MFNFLKKLFNVKEYDNVMAFKGAVSHRLLDVKEGEPIKIKVRYVKGIDKKDKQFFVIKRAVGITNVSYYDVLNEELDKLSKRSYLYRLIKHKVNNQQPRAWGTKQNKSIVKLGRKKYINAIIKSFYVEYGMEKLSKRKMNSADKIALATGINPRNFDPKHILSIKIGKTTYKNNNLLKRVNEIVKERNKKFLLKTK